MTAQDAAALPELPDAEWLTTSYGYTASQMGAYALSAISLVQQERDTLTAQLEEAAGFALALRDLGSALQQERDELRAALGSLVEVIAAAGLHNLQRGVQLGPTVWFVKASDAMDFARAALIPKATQPEKQG